LSEDKPNLAEIPRIYDVFDVPKVKSIRAITKIHGKIDLEEVLNRVPNVKSLTTSNKNVVRFEIRRGSYLLLFPTGYVEVHAPDEGAVREVLVGMNFPKAD